MATVAAKKSSVSKTPTKSAASLSDVSASTPARKNDPLPKEKLLAMYEQMLLIRRFEEKAGQLYGMGLIGGFCHLYIGQEAVVKIGRRAHV